MSSNTSTSPPGDVPSSDAHVLPPYATELREFAEFTVYGGLFGLMYGALRGAREGKQEALRVGQVPYKHMQTAMFREAQRYGIRSTAFFGVMSGTGLALQHVRNKEDMWNLTAATSIAGGLYRIRCTSCVVC
eukprot:TRINITY_DN3018_c0_g1_i1.p1 TRINITY_DN3018_c0_g1~~TRINITY_DN3018_c0_g1_i1.p1  ORF type:complete len:132 (+),score=6.29 TRINITY_DN3018_c0_g1_i1:276-671(+)